MIWCSFFVVILLRPIDAYPNGAPCEAVDRLQPGPGHGDPQTSPSPYGLRVLLGNEKVRDGIIQSYYYYTIEIYGLCGQWTPIKGFLLKAINATTDSVIGRFSKEEQAYWQATHYACRNRQLGAVTHFLSYERDQPVSFKWVLDDGPKHVQYNDVRFEATVVQNLKTYWKNISWPEPKDDLCRCPDKDEFQKSCLGYFRFGYCYLSSVKDDLCPYTCNNCSGNITLEERRSQSQQVPDSGEVNEGATLVTISNGNTSNASSPFSYNSSTQQTSSVAAKDTTTAVTVTITSASSSSNGSGNSSTSTSTSTSTNTNTSTSTSTSTSASTSTSTSASASTSTSASASISSNTSTSFGTVASSDSSFTSRAINRTTSASSTSRSSSSSGTGTTSANTRNSRTDSNTSVSSISTPTIITSSQTPSSLANSTTAASTSSSVSVVTAKTGLPTVAATIVLSASTISTSATSIIPSNSTR